MATRYSPNREAEEIGHELMAEYHQHLINNGVRVEFINRSDVPNSNGKERWAEAKKVTGLNAYLPVLDRLQNTGEAPESEPFFVILISEPIWSKLKDHQKRALIDHELMHCWVDETDEGEIKLVLLGHDFEGFRAEIERHGLWRDDAEKMAKSMRGQLRQMELPLDDQPRRRKLLREEAGSNGLDSITIEAGGETVTVSPETLERAARHGLAGSRRR